MSKPLQQVPVVVLCGGQGVVLGEGQRERLNKALVSVQDKPLFWWVVLHYARHGATDFILAAGLQAENFDAVLRERCGTHADPVQAHVHHVQVGDAKLRIRVVATPVEASTAARLLACKEWLADAPKFALSYSDTLSDVDLGEELAFHEAQGTVATLVSTQVPVRFRILGIRHGESKVRAFAPRPVIEAAAINGGFYFFNKDVWDARFALDGSAPLETTPLEKLAAAGQLTAFEHRGAWQHCDAERDLAPLSRIAQRLAADFS